MLAELGVLLLCDVGERSVTVGIKTSHRIAQDLASVDLAEKAELWQCPEGRQALQARATCSGALRVAFDDFFLPLTDRVKASPIGVGAVIFKNLDYLRQGRGRAVDGIANIDFAKASFPQNFAEIYGVSVPEGRM